MLKDYSHTNKDVANLFIYPVVVSVCLIIIFGTADAGKIPSKCVVIDKAKHRIFLYEQGAVTGSFPVSLGIDYSSPKRRRGDGSTPEGRYHVTYKKQGSKYHKFLGISFPNEVDAWLGLRAGLISLRQYHSIADALSDGVSSPAYTSLGGGIGIHGGGVYRNNCKYNVRDWTRGCVAVDDQAMDVIYSFCDVGDSVVIFNSNHQFFDMMRPFGFPVGIDKVSWSNCEKARHLSELGFITDYGQVLLRLQEGTDYSRSIEILLFGERISGPPSFRVFDHNGDGRLEFGDSQTGYLDAAEKIRDPYSRLRDALIKALEKGQIWVWPEK